MNGVIIKNAETILFENTTPFIPKYGFQDSYHRLKTLIITSDLPSAGECSMNGEATYRILTDFEVTHSTGMIETSAAKKSYLNTDNNYLSEIPPGNITYACANGTHGRLILLRGSYPLYSCLISVVTHCTVQNPYDTKIPGGHFGYYTTDPSKKLRMKHEPLRMAPGTHFQCKLVFLSKHTEPHHA
jgi:hypothetical protein